MKKEGFTLVEMLAVVVILGLVALVTIPAVSKSIRDARADKENVNIDTILNTGYDFVQQNLDYMPELPEELTSSTVVTGRKICTQQLICAGLLKEEIATGDAVKDFKSHSITVTYYGTAPSEEIPNSKFFGKYLLKYEEDSSCATYTCTNPT